MTRRRRPGSTALTATLTVALTAALGAVLLAGGLADPTLAQQGGPPAAEPTGTLTVTDVRPRAPRPNDPFQVLGEFTNDGAEPLTSVTVRLSVGSRIVTRQQLRDADAERQPGYPRGSTSREPVAEKLAAGENVTVDLRTTVAELALGGADPGIYPLRVQVQGRGPDGGRVVLDEARTYVPWFADRAVDPLRIAFALPLADVPGRAPDGTVMDDALIGDLAPTGRLGAVLGAARAAETGRCAPEPQAAPGGPVATVPAERRRCTPTPVTFVVDPELVDDAGDLADGFQVSGEPAPRPPAASAADFLDGLRGAVEGPADLLALPYADPDVVALTRTGAGLDDVVGTAREYGESVVTRALGVTPLQTVVAPPPGVVTGAALEALSTATTRAVVLDERALPPLPPDRTFTPGARARLPGRDGPVTGLVVDAGLSSLLTAPAPDGARLAEQRWLVETALIANEQPNNGRTLLVATPRRGPVDPGRLAAALADTGRSPWMCAVTLDDVAAGTDDCPAPLQPSPDGEPVVDTSPDPQDDRDGALLTNPAVDTPTARELSPDVVARAADLRDASGQFTDDVLTGGTQQAQNLTTSLQLALLRTVSSAWREEPAGGDRLAHQLEERMTALFGAVVLRTGPVLLTSQTSKLQVAVINELDLPVTVQVRLTAPSVARLSTADPVPVEIAPRSSQSVTIDTETLTSGRFVVQAQLLDRQGNAFGEKQSLRVRSTRYGTLALAVTGIAAAVLLVAAGVRITRRALHRPRAPA